MRVLVTIPVMAIAVLVVAMLVPLRGDDSITPLIELQSGPLTPGLELADSPRTIHQIRLIVDAKLKSGKLILDGNHPEFNEFGDLVGGLHSPDVRGKGDARLMVEIACSIELVKERVDGWRLYRIGGRELLSRLRVATRGSIDDGGPARLVVVGQGDKVATVVECTRYGLAVP